MAKLFMPTVVTAGAPAATDDANDGYKVGQLWLDTATGILRVLTDNTVGAAVWASIGSGGGGTAAGTTFTPAGTVAATNVQAAIQELDTDIQSVVGGTGVADKIFLSQNFI